MQKKENVVEFTIGEVLQMVKMIAALPPDTYVKDRAKAMVYKCKDALAGDYATLRIIP